MWSNPLTCLRVGKVYNLRMDPYERADVVSDQYYDWMVKNAYLMSYGVMKTAAFLETFVDYPPSQIPASMSPPAMPAHLGPCILMKREQIRDAKQPH